MVDDVDGVMDGVSDVDGVVVSVLLLFAGLMIYPDKKKKRVKSVWAKVEVIGWLSKADSSVMQ